MRPPSIPQQYGLAYAPKPLAAASAIASCYMMYHLVSERSKLRRLYNRLVLAMNVALLPMSLAFFWGNWAIPRGTPNVVDAFGTTTTCTAQGFLVYMYTLTVPIYYVSLILQALMGVRHSFEEEKYAHIEKWIHAAAYVIPGACAAVLAATENFNPAPAMCWDKKAPLGCESNAEMECVRGQDVGHFGWILAVFMLLLYFVFPLLVATSMYCWVNKSQENMRVVSQGFREMRERAKKQMMESIAKQICVYLFLFWIIWLFSTIEFIHWSLTGEYLYNIMILGYVMYSAQGVIFAVVYFSLQKIGRVRSTLIVGSRGNNTVENLKASIEGRGNASQTNDDISETIDFNIFDGTADEDSPWARFIDPDSSDDEVDEQACEEEVRER